MLLGKGAVPASLAPLPQLPDVADKQGPLAGMLAAMRWQPEASWLFLSCDMPLLTAANLQWVLNHRAPGIWGVLPHRETPDEVARAPLGPELVVEGLRARADTGPAAASATCPCAERPGHPLPHRSIIETVEPLPGWYDFRARHLLESCQGPSALARREKILSPLIPEDFATAWTNVNTQSELEAVRAALA